MKPYVAPFFCVLIAACSNHRQQEASYAPVRVEADDSQEQLVPASSYDADRAAERPIQEGDPLADSDADAAPAARSAPDTAPAPTSESQKTSPSGEMTPAAADNTKVNQRDRDSSAVTPIDQGENAADLETTQQIRKAVVASDALSFKAKNVKIITANGKVTLRGPVKSAKERETIAAIARKVAGAANVDNQLEVAK